MGQDKVVIKDLLLRGIIGINDWEREKRQDILINITLLGDLKKAGQSDDIEDAINYRTVTKQVIQLVETSQRFTVEALAADIARIACLTPGVTLAKVKVEKPGALRFAESVGVEIERRPADFA
jgi:FolB domain-containing protein